MKLTVIFGGGNLYVILQIFACNRRISHKGICGREGAYAVLVVFLIYNLMTL